MYKKINIAISLSILTLALVLLYFNSNLSRSSGTVIFSSYKQKGMGTMEITAPFGYSIVRFNVVPNRGLKGWELTLGGKGSSFPIGFFDKSTSHSTSNPTEGSITDIPVNKYFKVTDKLNYSAIAEMPDDKEILEKCGKFIILTKDRSVYDKLDTVVSKWSEEFKLQSKIKEKRSD